MHNDTKLQHGFLLPHLAIQPYKLQKRHCQLATSAWLRTHVVCSQHQPRPIYCTFLWNGKVYPVSPDSLSVKGHQCQTKQQLSPVGERKILNGKQMWTWTLYLQIDNPTSNHFEHLKVAGAGCYNNRLFISYVMRVRWLHAYYSTIIEVS